MAQRSTGATDGRGDCAYYERGQLGRGCQEGTTTGTSTRQKTWKESTLWLPRQPPSAIKDKEKIRYCESCQAAACRRFFILAPCRRFVFLYLLTPEGRRERELVRERDRYTTRVKERMKAIARDENMETT